MEMTEQKQTQRQNNFPKIHVKWIRGRETVECHRPKTFLNLGQRGSGKSSLLEAIASEYPKIIDMFGSHDSEGLAWCRSPFKDSVLFIVGDSVKISSEWPSIKVSELSLKDFQDYDIITSVHAFYGNSEEEFKGLNRILGILYQRTHWNEPWFLMVREAANFIYSRIKLTKNQFEAKADFIYLLREARHMGYAIGVDTIRWTAIDVEIRDVSDYTFLKSMGRKGLPPDLRFIYRYINPYSMMRMKPNQFVLITDSGAIGIGNSDYPAWHKEEKEDLVNELGIELQHGPIPDYGNERRNTVSDFEHVEIVKKYAELKSMQKVAKALGRSPATVKAHIDVHEGYEKSLQPCPKCSRVS